MTKFPGIGPRVAERLRAQGFWKHDRPDVSRFCRERGYRPQYVYAWLQDRTPDYENLRRLARDFAVPVAWLVSGEMHATAPPAALRGRRRKRSPAAVAPSSSLATGVDVTMLRDAADKVIALNADLDAAVSAFPLPCLWLDEAGRILGVHGVPDPALPRTSTGHVLREVVGPEAALVLHRALARALGLDQPVTVEYRVETGLGPRVYEARVSAVKSTSRPRRAFVVFHDVTERRARESEYRQLVDGSPNGLCIHRDYSIVFANQSMARLFGYTRGTELLGRDIRSLLPDHVPSDSPVARHRHPRFVPPGKRSAGVTRNGGTVEVTVLVSSVVWASGPATLVTVLGLAGAGR